MVLGFGCVSLWAWGGVDWILAGLVYSGFPRDLRRRFPRSVSRICPCSSVTYLILRHVECLRSNSHRLCLILFITFFSFLFLDARLYSLMIPEISRRSRPDWACLTTRQELLSWLSVGPSSSILSLNGSGKIESCDQKYCSNNSYVRSSCVSSGNGSPDVFSTYSAFRASSGTLAIGELLGAASFIVSVVVGSMALVKPFKVHPGPFIRDVGFAIVAVGLVLGVLWDGKLMFWETSCMIGLYCVYVAWVVGGTWYMARRREGRIRLEGEEGEEGLIGGEMTRLLRSFMIWDKGCMGASWN